MIKTLRITSIVAAALAVVFLVSSVVFGFRGDPKIEEFLNSKSVVDRFKEAGNKSAKAGANAVSPIVAQAEAFSRYLDPPKPHITVPRPSTAMKNPVAVKPVAPTAQFKLIGISFCEAKPSESLAFIDEVGKGPHWVRTNSSIGDIKIESVKEDRIVLNDGRKSFDMEPEAAQVTSAVSVPGAPSAAFPPSTMRPGATMGTFPATAGSPIPRPATRPPTASTRTAPTPPRNVRTAPPITPERAAQMEALVEQLKRMRKNVNKEKTGGTTVDPSAAMEKLMNGATSRVSEDEAKKLGNLGKQLNNEANHPSTKIPPKPPVSRLPRNSR